MTWMSPPLEAEARAAHLAVESAADWSPWQPFEVAVADAPRLPGVYLFREPATGLIRYVGMAGERTGGGRPQGLRGRLNVYRTGKGAVSGFGEAALDRALAEPDWIQQRLDHLRAAGPQRAKEWAASAIASLQVEVSWATTLDRSEALQLERKVVTELRPHGLWNR